ncbi:S1C family serine protease [Vulgatibacter incomptus]|uniref:HtrA protease/chaperone protein n=1 Tax=Vulgatibacter incomptus TaxID=1391653 RepID=A0A0K1P935_9BACT|nr:trypsin-like peptidase domain-containing protein [Vulgatibacter incomptus]AKU90043.1 HtrA protease/chaperone protein [Vulgatibacter incomptus]
MGRFGRTGLLVAAALLLGAPVPSRTEPPRRIWTEIGARAKEAGPAAHGLPNLSQIVKQASPAVVSIVVEEKRNRRLSPLDPLHDFFEKNSSEEPNEGLGTGFIIDSTGLILTNAHVIENASRIRVVLDDEGFPHELEATVVGADSATDLALLRVSANHPLPVLPLGDSDAVEIADWVVAIGNPFGLTQTVTFGIVSQKGRTDVTPQGRHGYFDFIQTDASINPGNSGGPLINLQGEVVAINNAVNASGQGIGFAVPINMAKKVIPQLAATGKVTRAWIGLSIRDVPWDLAQSLGLHQPGGVVISKVTAGSPAAEAGLEDGDVILRFENRPIRSAPALRWEVACSKIGSKVPLQVLRKGKTIQLAVTLRELPDEARTLGVPADPTGNPGG